MVSLGAGALLFTVASLFSGASSSILLILALCATTALAGAVPLARGSRRLKRRRRWLGQVQSGDVPDWIITPLTSALAEEMGELPPLFHESAEKPVAAILARQVRGVERGAYRTSTELIPIATLTQMDLERS